jgi:hypothetical protein
MIKDNHFIVIGGHKCGTTSLHSYLEQHPEICLPKIKGQDFFSRMGNNQSFRKFEDYIASYDEKELFKSKVSGEVSSVYLYSDKARKLIKQYLPDAKLIIILRNPVDRCISHFLQNIKIKSPDNIDFQDIFSSAQEEILKLGFYSQYIQKYLEDFPKENLKFILFDSLIKQANFVDFFEFIGVESGFQPDTSAIMRKGGIIDNRSAKIINYLRSTIGQILKPITTKEQRRLMTIKAKNYATKKIETPQTIKFQLIDLYYDEIVKVQEITGVNLSKWLAEKPPVIN